MRDNQLNSYEDRFISGKEIEMNAAHFFRVVFAIN